jgi:hypothetical protein
LEIVELFSDRIAFVENPIPFYKGMEVNVLYGGWERRR